MFFPFFFICFSVEVDETNIFLPTHTNTYCIPYSTKNEIFLNPIFLFFFHLPPPPSVNVMFIGFKTIR